MTEQYEVVPVMRYIVRRVSDQATIGYTEYTSPTEAQRMLDSQVAKDLAAEQALQRARAAAQSGKWTPASLRARMLEDPTHWEVEFKTRTSVGEYRCVWRELDDQGRPEMYGEMYIVYCHDAPDKHGVQFELTSTLGTSPPRYRYLTADRLAKALIRRGALQAHSIRNKGVIAT